jgi:AcrR family transcriptional regulator
VSVSIAATVDRTPSGEAIATAAPLETKLNYQFHKAARRPILDAAAELLLTRGLTAVSLDAMAERAGVSKATIYRWWPTKEVLALDALQAEWTTAPPRVRDTGILRGDLLALLRPWVRRVGSRPYARLIAALVTEAHTDPAFAAEYHERFVEPPRDQARVVFRRAIERGEIPPDTKVEVAIAGLMPGTRLDMRGRAGIILARSVRDGPHRRSRSPASAARSGTPQVSCSKTPSPPTSSSPYGRGRRRVRGGAQRHPPHDRALPGRTRPHPPVPGGRVNFHCASNAIQLAIPVSSARCRIGEPASPFAFQTTLSTSSIASTKSSGASCGRLWPTPPVSVRCTYLPVNRAA